MKLRRIIAGILAVSTVFMMTACQDQGTSSKTDTSSKTENSSTTEESKNDESKEEESKTESGEKLVLKVLTHRTDRKEDGSLEKMTKAFEEKYNCTVEYQAFKDYAGDVSTMMSTTSYGDVLMIPDTVKVAELGNFFEPLGSYDELKETYMWADQKMHDGTVYGLAHLGSVSGGICYSKKVWEAAGITTAPKTAEEFINALKQIEEKTDAIPYYTNYKDASWTASQWCSLVMSASGNANYETDKLTKKEDLFIEGDAYYNVFKLMYDIYSDSKLIEGDPMGTDWEGSKLMIAKGEIATMTMGSWAVSQFKQIASDNGLNPDDIGYMPAPFTAKDGKQYAQLAADYCMGVNKNSAADVKELGKKYIEWFIKDSGFSESEQSVNALKGSKLPGYLSAFEGCEYFTAATAPEGLTGVWNAIDNDSEVGIWAGDSANFKLRMAEAAFAGEGDAGFKTIIDEMNSKWNATRDANEALKAYLAG